MLGNMSKLAKLVNKLGSWQSKSDNMEEDKRQREAQMEKTEKLLQEYQPQIPGKVVYCYRWEVICTVAWMLLTYGSTGCNTAPYGICNHWDLPMRGCLVSALCPSGNFLMSE